MYNYMSKPLYGIVMGLLGLSSCIGHGIILLVLKRKRTLVKQNLLLSLGISDCLIAVHAFMSTCAAFSSSWPFGDIGCQIDSFLGMTATFASVSAASWIAKEKYYKVCEPDKNFNAKIKVQCLWIGALIGGGLPFFGFGEFGYETDIPALRTGCLLNFKNVGVKYWIYITLIFLMWFIWPLYDILRSYCRISEITQTFYWPAYVIPLQLLVSLIPYTIFAFESIFYDVEVLPGFYVALNNIAAKVMIATNPYLYIVSDAALKRECVNFLFQKAENNKRE